MKNICGIAVAAIFFMAWNTGLLIAQSSNSDFIVVANKQIAGESINKKALKGIYLCEVKNWSNGNKIIVVNLDGGGDFYQNLFGKTSVQMQAYWLNMRIKYSVDLPVTKKDAASVKRFIASNKGAIGFIKKSDLDDTVKTLNIIN